MQVEALERVYAECPRPSSARRQQLLCECPIVSSIEPKHFTGIGGTDESVD